MTSQKYPHEFRIPVQQELIRSIRDPHLESLTVIHAIVKTCYFPNGKIPDKINPRSHEDIQNRMSSKVPSAIKESLESVPESFHLLNRGCLIVAQKAWYDNKTKMLHFIIGTEDEHGMVDGATTDRVLANLKNSVSQTDFYSLQEAEIPEHFKCSFLHIEIVAGDISEELRIQLAEARNTSEQVKEFSLQDLGGNFSWLKDILEATPEFRGKIRYRENDPKPVDVRIVLGLLTLFHPEWEAKQKEPIIAYRNKGTVLDYYSDKEAPEWKSGYEALAPVVKDILTLYEFIHESFPDAYKTAYNTENGIAKLGRKKEIHFIPKRDKAKELPLTGRRIQYVLPDGWLYPLLASFRALLSWPKNGRGEVKWHCDPFEFFKRNGHELVEIIVDASEELGRNPNATGKSKNVWKNLRTTVENQLYRQSK